MTDEHGTITNTYDERERLLSVKNPDESFISYGYDMVGNVTNITTGNGITYYTYNNNNLMKTVMDSNGDISNYSYNAEGRCEKIDYPNGVMTIKSYDEVTRLISIENRKSDGTVISSYHYSFDPAVNVLNVHKNTGRTVGYLYDTANRLIEEDIVDSANGSQTINYFYDDAGNRVKKSDDDGDTIYVYDENDRLISENAPENSYIYEYDMNGNLITVTDDDGQSLYYYNYENKLVEFEHGSDITQLFYNYNGELTGYMSNDKNIQFVVDNNRPLSKILQKKNITDNAVKNYTHGLNLISSSNNEVKLYYHHDGQKSIRSVTNILENVIDNYTYDAFGNQLNFNNGIENNILYTDERYVENLGLYYLRARYYNPRVGRFITADPFKGGIHKTITLNNYIYANASPLNYLDPTGYNANLGEMMTVAACMTTLVAAYNTTTVIRLMAEENTLATSTVIGVDIGFLIGWEWGLGGGFSAEYIVKQGKEPWGYMSLGPSFGWVGAGGSLTEFFEVGPVWNIEFPEDYEGWYFSTTYGSTFANKIGVPSYVVTEAREYLQSKMPNMGLGVSLNFFYAPFCGEARNQKRSYGYTIGGGSVGSSSGGSIYASLTQGFIFQNNFRYYWLEENLPFVDLPTLENN